MSIYTICFTNSKWIWIRIEEFLSQWFSFYLFLQ
jgi:hypothetical protein